MGYILITPKLMLNFVANPQVSYKVSLVRSRENLRLSELAACTKRYFIPMMAQYSQSLPLLNKTQCEEKKSRQY